MDGCRESGAGRGAHDTPARSTSRGSTVSMPKTASKRAEARKVARVQRAHEALPPRPGSAAIKRRVPLAAARAEPRGVTTLIRYYPWATTIFFLLLVGLVFLVIYNQPPPPSTPTSPPPHS